VTSRDSDDDVTASGFRVGEHVVLLGLVGHGSSEAIPELESGVRSNIPQPLPVNITTSNHCEDDDDDNQSINQSINR